MILYAVSAIKVLNHNALIANGGYWQMKNILRIFYAYLVDLKFFAKSFDKRKPFTIFALVFPGTSFVCREGVFEIKGCLLNIPSMMDSPLEYGNVFPTPNSILEADYGERSGEKKNYEKKLFIGRFAIIQYVAGWLWRQK